MSIWTREEIVSEIEATKKALQDVRNIRSESFSNRAGGTNYKQFRSLDELRKYLVFLESELARLDNPRQGLVSRAMIPRRW